MMSIFDPILSNLIVVPDFVTLLFRLGLDLVFAYLIVYRIYFLVNQNREYLFTFFVLNILIFFSGSMLADAGIKTGFAFGLFAIFSILRYRTEQVNIKEMTFLFICIIIGIINSTVTAKVPLATILLADVFITFAVYILEKSWLKSYRNSMVLVYENIQLIHTKRHEELLADLSEKTGLNVHGFDIIRLDYLRDSAEMTIWYDRYTPTEEK